jgi:hypothetical protein
MAVTAPAVTTAAAVAPSVTTTPAVAPVPATPQGEVKPTAPAPAGEDWAQKYRRLEAEVQKKTKEQITERRKWDADRKATGERLTKLTELEKREQQARLNPTAYLKSLYGDDWHQVVTDAKISGVPPAQLVEAEMAKMRDEFEAKLKARDEEGTKSLRAQQEQALEQARASIRLEAEDFYEASGKDFPILDRLGDKAAVARALAQRIESEFHSSAKRDESGAVLRQGRVLTAKEAAELIEGEMLGVAEAALKAEKYRARFAPKPPDLSTPKQAATVSSTQQQSKQQSSNGQQPRKSLSNDITGSTKDEAPHRLTPQERRQAALDAYNAERARKRAAAS